MSNQTGFDYEVMLSRLHGGLCAFQSLRAHRRQREQAAAPAPTTEARATPEERAKPGPARAAHVHHIDEQAPGSPEPQAFVAVGDRVVPLFGSLNGLFGVAPAPSAPVPAPTASATPLTSMDAPAPSAAATQAPQLATATAPTASTLKLPPPMPPPRLGLIYGGHPPPPEPTAATEPSIATPRTPLLEPPTARPQAPAQPQEAPSVASITARLDDRAQADAQRLEQVHAEHRAVLATVLREHRDELRAQGEAEAARTTQQLHEHRDELRAQREADAVRTAQLLREVFAEHRAELARANQSHADHLAQILAQQRHPDPNTTAGDTGELRAALLEQASLQREANEEVADHISALTTIVADLGQTVGMLAVEAAHKAQQSQLPTRPTFTPPARVEPAASSRPVDPIASAAPASARVGPTAPAPSDTTPPAANQPRARPETLPSRARSEAAERARLQKALEDDSEDDIAVALASADDDPMHCRRLRPLSAIEKPEDPERDDDD
ncbi:MAG: hypothetical protein IPG88_25025 [Gemmatimonadetes bacterium]|nr:hypothetical protein [Gemmatimonadota bacterium]